MTLVILHVTVILLGSDLGRPQNPLISLVLQTKDPQESRRKLLNHSHPTFGGSDSVCLGHSIRTKPPPPPREVQYRRFSDHTLRNT